MIQVIFFALLIVALLGGFFAYYTPAQKSVSPVKFMMDNSGYNSTETINHKKSEQIHMKTDKGLMVIRQQMDNIALEQKEFLDTVHEQQQILNNTTKDATDIMLRAQRKGEASNKDLLQLRALTSEMKDAQRLLVVRGQNLISLNDQLTKNRQSIAEQVDLANINTQSSLDKLQQRSASLNKQANGFFDQVTQQNQDVRNQIDDMQSKLQDTAKNVVYDDTVQQQNIMMSVRAMMDQEHENMLKLADNEERSRNLVQQAKESLADSKERSDDLHQKQEDQQSIIQQRIADEKQRIQDQQAQRNQ
jgi:hypothetical protein